MKKQINTNRINFPLSRGGITLFFLLLYFSASSQHLQNPSFEGVIAAAQLPQGWKTIGQASSPDTQPGAWSVNTPASHGNSYLSMVCRGFSIIDSYLWEACSQRLNNPLFIGQTYHYSIDLAHSTTFLADTILFDKPVKLRIWGMSENQEKEILWESKAISNTNWETVYFDVTPTIATDYLVLEAYYTELPKYCGNILIDNIQYYPTRHSGLDPELPPIVAIDTIPTEINGRPINTVGELVVKSNKLSITVWDNRQLDGDIVSLFINGKNILKEFTLSKNRFTFEVELTGNEEYILTLYAHNLGSIPPNTVALYINDGYKKKMISLHSDLEVCGSIKIKIEKELVGVN